MSKVRSIQRAAERQRASEAEITLTLGTLMNSLTALQRLASQPLPARQAFKLSKFLKALGKEQEQCVETAAQIRERFEGKPNADKSGFIFPSKAKEAEAEREFADLMQTEITVHGERLEIESLPGLISAGDILVLSWLIRE